MRGKMRGKMRREMRGKMRLVFKKLLGLNLKKCGYLFRKSYILLEILHLAEFGMIVSQ